MAAISFRKFDSADFATIEQSIEHAAENPFLLTKLQNQVVLTRNAENLYIAEPTNDLQQFIWMLDEFLVEETMHPSEYYMPEKTSKRLYDSHDFWYVCMLVNGCSSVTEYRYKTIKVLPPEYLYHIETFAIRAKRSTLVIPENDDLVIFK